jgi:hypothetical protein
VPQGSNDHKTGEDELKKNVIRERHRVRGSPQRRGGDPQFNSQLLPPHPKALEFNDGKKFKEIFGQDS